jgi:hypothetical protein
MFAWLRRLFLGPKEVTINLIVNIPDVIRIDLHGKGPQDTQTDRYAGVRTNEGRSALYPEAGARAEEVIGSDFFKNQKLPEVKFGTEEDQGGG